MLRPLWRLALWRMGQRADRPEDTGTWRPGASSDCTSGLMGLIAALDGVGGKL